MAEPRTLADLGYVDVVDFVQRTTYQIWNDRRPDLVAACYLDDSVIWSDAGDVHGAAQVTENTTRQQAELPTYRGVILDTIWTGDDERGYRTSMRLIGMTPAPGRDEPLWSSCIANCVIVDGRYVEEWGTGHAESLLVGLGLDLETEARALSRSQAPVGAAARAETRRRGASVAAVPEPLTGPGRLVADLVQGLYGEGRLELVERYYAPGAPFCYGMGRWVAGVAGVRAEVSRWLDLLDEREVTIEELYWNEDGPQRARVAVRFLLRGVAVVGGEHRPVALTAIHHLHVNGGRVVAEWAEYNDSALRGQLAGPLSPPR